MTKNLLYLFILIVVFSSCAEKPEPVNEPEKVRELYNFEKVITRK